MVKINKDECIGCALCESICPEGFRVVNNKAKIINKNAKCIREAAKACTARAIII